jgi:hypothetical protein
MMEKYLISKFKTTIFLKIKIICFVNLENDPSTLSKPQGT